MRHQYKNSEDHLNNLRDWYQRRSADFKSFKYLENKKRQSFTNNLINENEKLKRSLEIENLNFLKEFENKINLINKYKYQQKQQQQKIIQNEEFIFNKNKDLYTRFVFFVIFFIKGIFGLTGPHFFVLIIKSSLFCGFFKNILVAQNLQVL
ncbi:unnamed protein product [Meloidogyne enterolobii]|uniref:Uncharacterized protein n=1 Tax=Meloidogyne enterolobii TaxID=390850 RepID=A0ACB1B4A5_MELEN